MRFSTYLFAALGLATSAISAPVVDKREVEIAVSYYVISVHWNSLVL
jgi:hypothetical protein